MRFVVPGEVGEFDIRSHLDFPSGARNLLGGCSCRAKAGLWVEFDEATTFDCLEPRQNALLISGQASILTIAKGQTMTPDGDSMIFTCKRSLLAKSPSVACPACVSAGEPCGGDICCEGLVCKGVIGGPPPTCQPQ